LVAAPIRTTEGVGSRSAKRVRTRGSASAHRDDGLADGKAVALANVCVDQLVPLDDGRWRDEERLRVRLSTSLMRVRTLWGAVRASLRMLKRPGRQP